MATPTVKVVRGQYYTSSTVADLMVSLASVSKDAAALEPGAGEGAFVQALVDAGFTQISAYDVDKGNIDILQRRFGSSVAVKEHDFVRTDRSERFDLIIGNPPYVKWNNIEEQSREALTSEPFWKELVNGEWDLLYAFIVWSIEKLEDNGELIFIVPYNWFNSTYAASLRNYMVEQGQFEVIIHFGEFKLFPDCYPNCIIFRYRKHPVRPRQSVWVADFAGRRGSVEGVIDELAGFLPESEVDTLNHERQEGEWSLFTMSPFDSAELWSLTPPGLALEADRLERACAGPLGEAAEVAVGLVSGFDKAYLVNDEELAGFSASERKLVRAFAKAQSCERFTLIGAEYHYIFADAIENEETLSADYPHLFSHLSAHRTDLEARYLSKNKRWWQWATVRNLALFKEHAKKGKIFVPCIDRAPRPRFAYTEAELWGAGDVLLVVPRRERKESPLYLLAWLNSEEVWRWWQAKGSRSGQRQRYTQAYVAKIPFRSIDFDDPAEVMLHDEIVALARLRLDGDRTAERAIGGCFRRLLARRASPVA